MQSKLLSGYAVLKLVKRCDGYLDQQRRRTGAEGHRTLVAIVDAKETLIEDARRRRSLRLRLEVGMEPVALVTAKSGRHRSP